MSRITYSTMFVSLLLVLAYPTWAGVVDSPLPAPFTQHVFTVPGVINRTGIGAFFSCTNLDAVNVTIGVEIFGAVGGGPVNDAAGTSLSVLQVPPSRSDHPLWGFLSIRTTGLEVS